MSRILGIVVGVLTVLLGAWCFLTPIETYGMVGWLVALALVADGASKVVLWNDYRKLGVSDTFALVGGILSVVLGVVLMGSMGARVAVDVALAYVVSIWLLAAGCVRIARSFQMRSVRNSLGTTLGSNWELALVAGILMVVLGIFCVANPVIVMMALGWQIGIGLIAGGIGLITATA